MSDLAIQDQGFRKQIIDEILGNENRERKEDAKIRFEVMQDRQDRFVIEKLKKEFGNELLEQMRIITSINPTKRIITEQASIYKTAPERELISQGDMQPSETEINQFEALYKLSKANVKLKKANKYYKLFDQCALQIIPKMGSIAMRVLAPHQYDVIPDPEHPEIGRIYILNIMDDRQLPIHQDQDRVNQKIGDRDDAEKRARMRFVWWSDQFNFTTDGLGALKSMELDQDGNLVPVVRPNPINTLPFIDIAEDKDFEFWVRKGKAVVGFNLELSSMLSDVATINKMQGYAQAVVIGENIPENLRVGPDRLIRLPVDPGTVTPPSFQFVNPNPDLASSLNLVDMLVNLFLSSDGLDTKMISGKVEANNFSSGVERFLAEISKFSATKDDFDLFEDVESQAFNLMRAWSNELQSTDFLVEELNQGTIHEQWNLKVEFHQPEMLMSRQEKEESIIRRLKERMISRVEAVAEDRDITEEQAEAVIDKIDEQTAAQAQSFIGNMEDDTDESQGSDDGESGRN
jgi:hypothetical protein